MVKKNKTASGAAAFRVLGVASDKSAPAWERKEVSAYLTASHRTIEDVEYLHVSADGARLGQPAEENVAPVAWAQPQNIGYYLSSVVSFGGEEGLLPYRALLPPFAPTPRGSTFAPTPPASRKKCTRTLFQK